MERRAGGAAASRRARGLRPAGPPGAEPTGRAIFRKDLEGLDWADTIVAIMDGADPDSGTCWECGYAYARGKTIVLFRSDVRRSGEVPDIPYNAMLIARPTRTSNWSWPPSMRRRRPS